MYCFVLIITSLILCYVYVDCFIILLRKFEIAFNMYNKELMYKVSVIIATHSRPNLLPRAVKSAFEAGTDVEVIVVDDASTDETAKVCLKLEGIKYIRIERNQRVAGARNLGILASTADYITFHDDDDLRIPGSLDKQVA